MFYSLDGIFCTCEQMEGNTVKGNENVTDDFLSYGIHSKDLSGHYDDVMS